MTNPNSIAIVRAIADHAPTTQCALGHGLHEARIEREAALLECFCQQLGIDVAAARQAIEAGAPLNASAETLIEEFA
jgi:hypothetical protein|tara:strand:+ start:71 stop:301 length:231 start_codon:yes stop_codon:yes gene_type:complete